MGLEAMDLLGFGMAFVVIALLLFAALVIILLLPTIQSYKARRSGWWIYLICFFLAPLNIAALIAWFAYFKKNPTQLGSSGIVV